MKKLLLLVVTLIVVSGVGLAVASHYQNTKNKTVVTQEPTVSVSVANKRVEDAKAAGVAEVQTWVGRYNLAVTECQKGKVAYDKLTAFIKGQTPQAVCPEPATVQ